MPRPTFKLTEPGPPVGPGDLKALEEEIGAQLPEHYKRFLLTCNGGFPDPAVAFAWRGELKEIDMFWRLLPTPLHELRRNFWELRELKVDGFLPIAGCLSEDICLALGDAGAVTLTERIYRDDSPVSAKMHRLAGTFSEFLDSLVAIPACPIEELGKRGTPEDLTKYLAEGNSLEAESKNGLTILCEAIKFNNIPMIDACIGRGACLSGSIERAVGNGYIDLIPRLVAAGADVNERNEYGDTPLKYVPGTALPGEEGARNRRMRDLLLKLGAHE